MVGKKFSYSEVGIKKMAIQLNYYVNVRTSGLGIRSCFFHKKIKMFYQV